MILLLLHRQLLMAFQRTQGDQQWFKVMTDLWLQTTPGLYLHLFNYLFTFFYAFVQVNPEKLIENLKTSAYIPSVWSKDTQNYISKCWLNYQL